MLKKKQYLLTLLAGILIFFIVFILSYFYMKSSSALPQGAEQQTLTVQQESVDASAELQNIERPKPMCIQPGTEIRLIIEDANHRRLEDKKLDPYTLLGDSEEEMREKFKDYELVSFNEREVELKKVLPPKVEALEYTLGIQENSVCIVEKGDLKHYISLNISPAHFSRATYSMLLKEQIVLSAIQKEELINNPNYIEQILQSYEEE